jgi:hypothetical protein
MPESFEMRIPLEMELEERFGRSDIESSARYVINSFEGVTAEKCSYDDVKAYIKLLDDELTKMNPGESADARKRFDSIQVELREIRTYMQGFDHAQKLATEEKPEE